MGSIYSNEPSETAGAICSICLEDLPPVSGWSDIKIKTIKSRPWHEFLKGDYYREKVPSAEHLCKKCFMSPEYIQKLRKEKAEISAKSDIDNLRKEVKSSKAEITKTKNELVSLGTKLSSVKTELSEEEGKLRVARNELQITEDKISKVKKELESTKDELAEAKSELAKTKSQVQYGELQTTATKGDNNVEEACAQCSKITKPKPMVKDIEHVATALEATDVEDEDVNTEASKDHATTTCQSTRYPVQVTEPRKDSESRDSNGNTIKPANAVDSDELGKTKNKLGNAQTKVQTDSIKSDAEGEASEYVATALEDGDAKDEAVKVEAAKDDVTTPCKSARFPSQATENCKDSESHDSSGNTINTMTVQNLFDHR